MTEPLILPAKVVDGFSTPLKNLVNRLKDVKVPDGMKQVGKQLESLRKEADGLGKAVTNGFGGLTSGLGLGALGAGAFTAAGALTAVGTAVRSFADNAVHMRKFSNATSISIAKLKEMQQVASGFGIDPGSIEAGMSFSAQNADAMRLRQGSYGAIAGLRGGRGIAEDLANTKSNDEVFEKELAYIAKQKTAQQRRVLSQLFFSTDEFAELGANGIEELKRRRAEARRNVQVPSDADVQKARDFQDAISHLSATFENLKNSVGGELAPDITAAADAFKEFASSHVGDVKAFFHDVVTTVEGFDWAGTAKNFKDLFDDIKSIPDRASDLKKDILGSGENGAFEKGSPFDRLHQWWKSESGSGQPRNDQEVPFWAPLSGEKKSSVNGSGSGSGQSGSDQDVPFWAPLPGAKKSSFDGSGSMVHPAAYHPGLQAAFIGASSARDSEAVATLAKGVELGMIAFTQSYLGNGAGTGKGGTDGVQNASWGGGRAVFGGGGTGGAISAESIRAVHARGSLAKNQKEAYDAFVAGGYSSDAARAMVANLSGEALGKPGDVHWDGSHYAHGIAQWDDVRSQRIKDQFGKFPQQMNITEQANAHMWELQKYYKDVDRKLKSGASVGSMIDTLVRKYEIPRDKARAISQRLGFLNGLPDFKSAAQMAQDNQQPKRRSTSKAAASAGLQGSGWQSVKPPTGRLDVIVTSKDQPVNVKASDSDIFQSLKINRGNKVST